MAPQPGREAALDVADPPESRSGVPGLDAADPLAGTPAAAGKRRPTKPLLLLTASVVVLLLVQLASMEFPDYVVPDVPTIAAATWQLLTEQGSEMLATLWRFALAMAAAIVGGWAIGLVMGSQRRLGEFGEAMTRIMLATPALSIILFVVLWFRSVEIRVFVVALVIAMPFYIIAVYEGVKAIDAEMVEAVRQFRPTRAQMFRLVLLPHSIANVIMATKSVAGFTLRIVVFAEVIAATSGVGSSMLRAQGNFRIDLIFGWTVILVVFNFVLMALLERAERALLRWRPENAVG
jgi:ABC-type nitrate/sulfonate/bicarbonate transport system permease component